MMCLQIKAGDSVISNDFDLAENFNDYFINVASSLKEPLEQSPFNELKEQVNAKIPEGVHFELPELDENFVFKFLSTLDISKATGLDGIGPNYFRDNYKKYNFILLIIVLEVVNFRLHGN